MQDNSTMDYKKFEDTTIDSLNKHTPLNRKYFIKKESSKAIMHGSIPYNIYLKVRSDDNRTKYKK